MQGWEWAFGGEKSCLLFAQEHTLWPQQTGGTHRARPLRVGNAAMDAQWRHDDALVGAAHLPAAGDHVGDLLVPSQSEAHRHRTEAQPMLQSHRLLIQTESCKKHDSGSKTAVMLLCDEARSCAHHCSSPQLKHKCRC